MALDTKQIFEALNFQGNPDEATIEQLREHLDKEYIGREVATQDDEIIRAATGKRFGAFGTMQTRSFKELGVEFSPEEIKGKKEEEIFQLGMQKVTENITGLKAAAKEGTDKKYADLEKKYQERETKWKETDDLLKTANDTISKKDSEFNNKVKSFTLNSKLEAVMKTIPISKDTSESFQYQLKGWKADIAENYEFDLEGDDLDTAELIVKEKKTGKRVVSGSKFDTVENVLLTTGTKAGVIAKNSGAGTPGPKGGNSNPSTVPTNGQNPAGVGSNGQPSNIFQKTPGPHPNAVGNVDRLNQAKG